MKHIFIYLLLGAYLFAPYKPPTPWDRAEQIVLNGTKNYSTPYRRRVLNCILRYGWKYQLPLDLWAKQIEVESDFNRFAYSSARCRGLSQISDRHWRHMLYRIDNGRLGRHIKRRGITNPTKYYYRIGYSLDMGGAIMRTLWDRYGCYKLALLRYAYTTKAFNRHRTNADAAQYIKDVYSD